MNIFEKNVKKAEAIQEAARALSAHFDGLITWDSSNHEEYTGDGYPDTEWCREHPSKAGKELLALEESLLNALAKI